MNDEVEDRTTWPALVVLSHVRSHRSRNYVPARFTGHIPWEGTGRPVSPNGNIASQLMSYGPSYRFIAPFQPGSNRPTGVYRAVMVMNYLGIGGTGLTFQILSEDYSVASCFEILVLEEPPFSAVHLKHMQRGIGPTSKVVDIDIVESALWAKGNSTISNDGATIMKLLDVVHPATQILVDIAKSQESEVGDGTTRVVLFAEEFLKEAKLFIEDGVHSKSYT
ncbi:hypothetical protein IFM89_025906 [Coptis chinensis]|uniref:Uncharacterized protein n=1 Tax=Coptis chinensis TaxID=261450 RepID=A0A835HQ93_9MAGN|nr:hypothetical protein IFM89_025906 [Coptis chinensis]